MYTVAYACHIVSSAYTVRQTLLAKCGFSSVVKIRSYRLAVTSVVWHMIVYCTQSVNLMLHLQSSNLYTVAATRASKVYFGCQLWQYYSQKFNLLSQP